MSVTKQNVKDYLDITDKSLADKMKNKIENPDNWKDFKSDLSELVSKYANNPTENNKRNLDELIERNYFSSLSDGKEFLQSIFSGLGIMTRNSTVSNIGKTKNRSERQGLYKRSL